MVLTNGLRFRRTTQCVLTWPTKRCDIADDIAKVTDHFHYGAGLGVWTGNQHAIAPLLKDHPEIDVRVWPRGPWGELPLFRGFAELDLAHRTEATKQFIQYPVLEDGNVRMVDCPRIEVPVDRLSVVSLSYQPPVGHRDRNQDVISLLLSRLDPSVLVVVAAGNDGAPEHGAKGSRTSIWAEHSNVLGVGATLEPGGEALDPTSSQGVAGDTDSGPDLVSWGVSGVDRTTRGTSFATPRVARCALAVSTAVWQLRAVWQSALGRQPHGVPVPIVGMIDDSYEHTTSEAPVHALPLVGPSSSLRDIVKTLGCSADEAGIRPDAALVRKILLKAVLDMPGYSAHQVGAGYLDDDLLVKWFQGLTWRELFYIAAPDLLKQRGDFAPVDALVFDPAGASMMKRVTDLFSYGWFWSTEAEKLMGASIAVEGS